jgi:hypothetical protein
VQPQAHAGNGHATPTNHVLCDYYEHHFVKLRQCPQSVLLRREQPLYHGQDDFVIDRIKARPSNNRFVLRSVRMLNTFGAPRMVFFASLLRLTIA